MLNFNRGEVMKKIILLLPLVFLFGCETTPKRKPFESTDLKIGMSLDEVKDICNGSLELIHSSPVDANGCTMSIYRMWPNETKTPVGVRCVAGTPSAVWAGGKDIRPYLLTFVSLPPLTKKDVDKIIEQKNIDPNSRKKVFNQLIGSVNTLLVRSELDVDGYQAQLNEMYGNFALYKEITKQRQPVFNDNSTYWQEQRARQEYFNINSH